MISDGEPNRDDDWENALTQLKQNERGQKSIYFSMLVGEDDEDAEAMIRFSNVYQQGQVFYELGNDENKTPAKNRIFYARDAKHINRFFEFVTMSAIQSTQGTRHVGDSSKLEYPWDKSLQMTLNMTGMLSL